MGAEKPLPTLHVDVEPGWRGGQRQVLLLCRGLARRGHPVTLVAREGGELAARARRDGLDVEEIAFRGQWDLNAGRRLAGLVRQRRPDVVGMHSSHSHALGVLARLMVRDGRPPFIVTRRVDFPIGRGLIRGWKYRRGVDGFIAISEAVRRKLVAGGVPEGRIRLVHSGVEPVEVPADARRELRRELDLADGSLVAGNVAGLVGHKDQATLLRAVRLAREQEPRLVVLLVGEGELRGDLERLSGELGLDGGTVRFLGFRSDVPRILGGLDLFVMSSAQEGLGTSIVDAMMAGVPVVATAAGGIGEVVEDGVTGRLVPPRDPERLASAMLEALRNRDATGRMCAVARERSLSRFSSDAMVSGTLAAYRELLKPAGRALP